ncbi:FAD-dependent oxidoreductase [Klebsiella pneumoniae subsp. pneumoniae]|nr:FAD-dependent oxidoreductase [Klebsiella pneumoniae subsp. pneumoniae]
MYDFVIIGGGIIGMSTAMQLIEIYPDARIALLEKRPARPAIRPATTAAGIHAGVYTRPAASRRSFASPATAPPRPLRAERHPL